MCLPVKSFTSWNNPVTVCYFKVSKTRRLLCSLKTTKCRFSKHIQRPALRPVEPRTKCSIKNIQLNRRWPDLLTIYNDLFVSLWYPIDHLQEATIHQSSLDTSINRLHQFMKILLSWNGLNSRSFISTNSQNCHQRWRPGQLDSIRPVIYADKSSARLISSLFDPHS